MKKKVGNPRFSCGVAKAAMARNSAGRMRHKQARRAKDARKHWSRDGGDA
jgi:hypothetical protein